MSFGKRLKFVSLEEIKYALPEQWGDETNVIPKIKELEQ